MELTKDEKFVREEISKIYDQLVINCKKTAKEGYEKWGHDLLPMCIEMFLLKDIDTQLKVISDGKLEHYLTFMMSLQLKSSSSRFYSVYRKEGNSYREILPDYKYKNKGNYFPEPFEDEEDPTVTCLKSVIQNLNPYERMVVNERIIGKEKFSVLSRKYNITYSTLKKDAELLKIKLQRKCRHLL